MNQSPSTGSSDIAADLRQDGEKLADTAKAQATTVASENKDKATSAVKATASAIETVADELQKNDDAPSWLGSAFKQAASSATELASSVDGKEPGEIVDEVSRFARDNPTAFLAVSALAGFAASRVLKAGAEQRDNSDVLPSHNHGMVR